jgi:hypothetical protein
LVYNTPTALTANGFTRTSYIFAGWNTAANGSGTSYADGANYTIGATPVTLYAQWTINAYTLTYAAGANGTITGTSPQTVNSGAAGTAVTATANSGYQFVSWSDGSITNPRTDTNVTNNISVTASFEIIPGNSTFIASNCTSVVYGDWKPCADGMQYRDVLSQSPANCVLTSAQQAARSEICDQTPITPTTPPANPAAPAAPPTTLETMTTEAGIISTDNVQNLLIYLGVPANPAAEANSLIKYQIILSQDSKITATEKTAINDFIVYGTPATQNLGSGERAGVINSYFQAYGKLPNSETEWSDVIKIANGRWPSERSTSSENQAKIEFKKVYGRNPLLTDSADQNAIMIIAYGLIPSQRNLASEIIAIKTFRYYYQHTPVSALAWNIVRAIAYSGAKR